MFRTMQVLLLCLMSVSVQAREVAGVHLDEVIVVPGVAETLKLNGTAIRSKLFFRIYVAALYVSEPSDKASVLLASNSPRRMMMHMLYSEVEKEKMAKAWQEGFEKNLPADIYSAMKPRLDRFNALFDDMKKNDVALIDYIPGTGTRVTLRGVEQGVVEGEDFFRAVLSVWIGDTPATEELKAGLLGHN